MLGDCLELMKGIPDGSVDMVLCDLPYGMTRNEWDSIIPFEPLWEQYHRVCKENAAVVLFCQMPFAAKLYMSNPDEFRYEWIWDKKLPTGFLNAKKMPLKRHENIYVFYRKLPVYNPCMEVRGKPKHKGYGAADSSNYGKFDRKGKSDSVNNIYYPVSIVSCYNPNNAEKVHPTGKPVPLLEYFVKTYSNRGETVLDNAMGGGSTGVACVNTGRNFIGIEKDRNYFDAARKRIDDAVEEHETLLFKDII